MLSRGRERERGEGVVQGEGREIKVPYINVQVHVIPRAMPTSASKIGGPGFDMMPYVDRDGYESMLRQAELIVERRALQYVLEREGQARPVVHLIKYETDTESIGEIICRKAQDLEAQLVVVAKHSAGKLQEMFLGSVASYCIKHCTRPCLVYHG